jgi:hypothetical protein
MVLNETMAVYRVHRNGVWSMKSKEYRYQKKSDDLDIIMDYVQGSEREYVEFNKLVNRAAREKSHLGKLRLYLRLAQRPMILFYFLARKSMVAWNSGRIREASE